MSSILKKIAAYKLLEIAADKKKISWQGQEELANAAGPSRGFYQALQTTIANNNYGLICELKKASPSKGLIRADFNVSQLASDYTKGGATCLSVLTDNPSFQGHKDFLSTARKTVMLPLLRKDFMFDPYQVVETKALGGDCILIIMAAVSDMQAQELEATAIEWQLDVLLEVHNQSELERALQLTSPLIGINNRNLNNFATSLQTSIELAPLIPNDRLIVAESGITTAEDLRYLAAEANINAFLIGESLMRQQDVTVATKILLKDK